MAIQVYMELCKLGKSQIQKYLSSERNLLFRKWLEQEKSPQSCLDPVELLQRRVNWGIPERWTDQRLVLKQEPSQSLPLPQVS